MSEHERDKQFLNRVKKSLDKGTENLDSGIQSRLTRVRHKALESKTRGWFPEWMVQPAVGWVSVACALLLVVLFFGTPGTIQVEPGLEDIDLLASADVLELYEDLEFYAWLAEEYVDAG